MGGRPKVQPATMLAASAPAMLRRLVEHGPADPVASALLAHAALAWLSQEGTRSLEAFIFGRSASPAAARRLLRDEFLREASRALGSPAGWDAARALERELRRFRAHRWPLWQARPEPPFNARPVERHLFHAFVLGVRIPSTSRQLRNIGVGGCETDSEEISLTS